MKKPIIDIISQLKEQLFQVSEIVNRIQRKEYSSVDILLHWLTKTEDILQQNGYAQSSELAGLRSRLIATDYSEELRSSKRKLKLRVSAEIIYDSQKTVLQIVQALEVRLDEARLLIKQILLVLKPTGAIDYDPKIDFNSFIQGIWGMLKSNSQVGGGASKVLILVSQSDALRILAEEIEL
jgi:hypothetical protein